MCSFNNTNPISSDLVAIRFFIILLSYYLVTQERRTCQWILISLLVMYCYVDNCNLQTIQFKNHCNHKGYLFLFICCKSFQVLCIKCDYIVCRVNTSWRRTALQNTHTYTYTRVPHELNLIVDKKSKYLLFAIFFRGIPSVKRAKHHYMFLW